MTGVARRIETLQFCEWSPQLDAAQSCHLAAELEAGCVLYLPQLAFTLKGDERRFIDPRWADPKAKNVSYDGTANRLAGAIGTPADLGQLRAMLKRFRKQAVLLVESLFPRYRSQLRVARTSLRPVRVEGRVTSWRKDDSRLHVDAFPSQPNRGERILRVFNNINGAGEARVWRIGEPFEDMAQHFLPEVTPPLPGSGWLLEKLHVTKSRRSRYDHIMLQLHDRMKADDEYQKKVSQVTVPFAAGSTWICFSDQASHAAMSGQHLLEQTLHLPKEALYDAERSPLRILERLTHRALV
jgi:hypothetical protein